MWGILGTAIARCTIKSRHGLLTIRGVYRSPWCLADEFAFSHICPWSMVNCCLIVGDFNAPHINSMEFTTSGGCFVNSLLLTIIRCALVQSFVKSTQWLRTWTAIAGPCLYTPLWWALLTTTTSPNLQWSRCTAPWFSDTIYSMYLLRPVPISEVLIFRQSEIVLSKRTGRSVQMGLSKTFESATLLFTLWSTRRLSHKETRSRGDIRNTSGTYSCQKPVKREYRKIQSLI